MTEKGDEVKRRIVEVNKKLKQLNEEELLERGVQQFHAVVDAYLDEEMNVCGALGCDKRGTSKCSGCNVRHYCCREHQTEHWKEHKKECKVLKGMASLREASREYCRLLDGVSPDRRLSKKERKELKNRLEEKKVEAKAKLKKVVSERVDMSASITDDALKNVLKGFSSVLIKLTFLSYVIDGHKALRRAFVIDALRHAAIIATVRGLEKEKAVVLRAIGVELARRLLTKKELGWIVRHVAGALDGGGLYFEAMIYRVQQLSLVKACYGEDHPNVATTLNNMAVVHESLGEYEMAMSKYEEALKIYKAVFGDQHEDVAMTLNNMAGVHQSLGEYEMAMSKYEEALKILKAVFGDQHKDVAGTLNNMAVVHQSLGEYEMAMSKYEEALKILKAVFGDQHKDVAATLNNMANVHQSLGEYEMAMSKYEEALKIRKAVFGDQHKDVATTLNNMAAVHQSLGEYEMAMSKYEEALKIYKAVFGDQHEDVAATLNNMAVVHQSLGEYEMAMSKYEEALKILKAVFGDQHKDVAGTLNNMANVHQSLGEYKMAMSKYEEALKIRKAVFGDQHESVAGTLGNMAVVHQSLGQYEMAMRKNEMAFDIYQRNEDHRHALQRLCACAWNQILGSGNAISDDLEKLPTYFKEFGKEISGASSMSLGNYRLLVERMSELALCIGQSGASILLDAAEHLTEAPLLAIRMQFLRSAVHVSGDVSDRCRSLTALATCFNESGLYLRALEHAQEAVALGGGKDAENLFTSIDKKLKVMSKLVDMDILAQLERLEEGLMELQMQIVDDLRANTSSNLSSFARNRTTELIVGAVNLLDQVYFRLVTQRKIGEQGVDAKVQYFPVESSKASFERVMRETKYSFVAPCTIHLQRRLPWTWCEEDWETCWRMILDAKCWEKAKGDKYWLRVKVLRENEESWEGTKFKWCWTLLTKEKERCWQKDQVLEFLEESLREGVWNEFGESDKIDEETKEKKKEENKLLNTWKKLSKKRPPEIIWWNALMLKECVDTNRKCFIGKGLPLGDWGKDVPGLEAALVEHSCADMNTPNEVEYVDFATACPNSWSLLQANQPYTAWRGAHELSANEGADAIAKAETRIGTWLAKASAIAVDAKHLRLTKQDAENNLRSERGLIPERDVQISIDYVGCLPQLYVWSFYDALAWRRSLDVDFRTLSKVSKTLRSDVFKDYFVHAFSPQIVFDALVHEEALAVIHAKGEKRQQLLEKFEQTVRADVAKCTETAPFADEAWRFIRARTLRRDPLQSLSTLEPDFRIDVMEFIPKVLKEVERVALTFGKEQVVGGRAAEFWSGHPLSEAERKLNAAALDNDMTTVCEEFRKVVAKCIKVIKGGTGNVDVMTVSALFDSVRVLAAAHSLNKGQWEEAGRAWSLGADCLEMYGNDHWWWLVARMREKAVRCLLLPAKQTANLLAYSLKREIAGAYMLHSVFERSKQAYGEINSIGLRAMDGDNGATRPGDRSRHALTKANSVRTYAVRGPIDEHIYEQLQHCRSQLLELRYEAFRVAVAGYDRRRLLRAMCLASEIAIKCRHVLEQALTQFARVCIGARLQFELMNCKFPTGGTAKRVEAALLEQLLSYRLTCIPDKEARQQEKIRLTESIEKLLNSEYSAVVAAVNGVQGFAFINGDDERWRQRWYDELVRWSNELKHARMQLPSKAELRAWCATNDGGEHGLLFIRLHDRRVYRWSFAFGGGCDSLAESEEVYDGLKESSSKKGVSKQTKQKQKSEGNVLSSVGDAGEMLRTESEARVRDKVLSVLRAHRTKSDSLTCVESKLIADSERIVERLMQFKRRELYTGFAVGVGCADLDESSKVWKELADADVLTSDGCAGPLLIKEDVSELVNRVKEALRKVRGAHCDVVKVDADSVGIVECLLHYVRDEAYTGEQIGLEALLQRALDGTEEVAKVMYKAVSKAGATSVMFHPSGDSVIEFPGAVRTSSGAKSVEATTSVTDGESERKLDSSLVGGSEETAVRTISGTESVETTASVTDGESERKLELSSVSGGEETDEIIDFTSLRNSGDLFAGRSEYAHAMLAYEKALMVQKKRGALDEDVALTLIRMAELHLKTGELSTALNLYEEALMKEKQVFGEEHERVAASLRNVASVHRLRGEYGRSLELLRNALEIEKKLSGEKSLRVASTLQSIAGLYEEIGELERAADLYEQALLL